MTVRPCFFGVILALATWLRAHMFRPGGGELDVLALLVGLVSAVALLHSEVGVIPLVAAAATAGLASHLLFA